jgi:ATP-dependent exoDNAse (exonuclease V) beta subunit
LAHGLLLHEWFQQIEWLDDGLPAEEALLRIAAAPQYAGLDAAAALAEFRAVLEKPQIRVALCRSAYDAIRRGGQCRALRERAFAVRQGDAILDGIIDRLVLCYDGDKITAAEVLDFKTDDLPDDPRAITARTEFYRPQLEAYRHAVARMYRLEEKKIAARLLFITPGRASAI